MLDKKSGSLYISYTRSDGSVKKLSIADIIRRSEALEMAYNPNDGIEIRWGAPENSDERATCRRHASSDQYQKMLRMRSWFRKRLHPPT